LPPLRSTSDLYSQIAQKTAYSVHRLRITKEDGSVVPNSDDATLAGTGLTNGATINVKDLGPQIAWRTVFVAEYLGPLLIHPAVYYLRPYIYPTPSLQPSSIPPPSQLQQISLALCVLHFLKRELETLFLHRFSAATMPATYILRNSGYYWALSGANMAYWIYSPNSVAQKKEELNLTQDPVVALGLVLFVIGEAVNFYTHYVLANLRPKGTTTRAIPRGFSFDWVTCPNYLWEAVAWIGIGLVTQSWSTALFISVALFMMGSWAGKKEKRYRKEFGDKYKKKRYVMIPGII
jgi:very-long-chain enoyl-CoA reductase